MSILIKGLRMPERCIDCELCTLKVMGALRTTCIICRHNGEEIALHGRREDCPLVELPPHGRLIDADALGITPIDITDLPIRECLMVYLAGDVKDAPTIIEPEGEE